MMNLELFRGLSPLAMILVILLIAWTGVWKAMALWKSARKKHIVWFIVFIFVNTLGILEILYLYVFSKMKPREEEKPVRHRRRTRARTVRRRTPGRRKRRR